MLTTKSMQAPDPIEDYAAKPFGNKLTCLESDPNHLAGCDKDLTTQHRHRRLSSSARRYVFCGFLVDSCLGLGSVGHREVVQVPAEILRLLNDKRT